MKIIITESQLERFLNRFINETYSYDEDVANVQKKLKDDYDLGEFGTNKDGVDGLLGPLTKKAMKKEMEKNPSIKDKFESLLKKHEGESDTDYDKKAKEYEEKPDEKSNEEEKVTPKSSDSNVVIYISGLHHRNGDLSVEQQKNKIMDGIKGDKKVFAFSWQDTEGGLKKLEEYPNASVVLFSRGTGFADKFASKIKNKNNLYVLEPYPKAKSSIQSALDKGVPLENIILGGGGGSGKGLFKGASETPRKYAGHWPSLEYIGTVIS